MSEESFIREVSILAKCSHPNIIRLIGLVEATGERNKVDGMILEFVEKAESLRDIQPSSLDKVKQWEQQIQGAVSYLHRNSLSWGDAKASNVLIGEDGNAKLIDFEGGYTEGWVDVDNSNTAQGDLQGVQRIISDMKSRICI